MKALFCILMLAEKAGRTGMTPAERKDYQKFLWGNADPAD